MPRSRTATAAAGQYQGYFDCALTTPGPAYGGGPACVRPVTRGQQATPPTIKDVAAARRVRCPAGGDGECVLRKPEPSATSAPAATGATLYVMRTPARVTRSTGGKVTIQGATFYGTLVVEGQGSAGCNGPSGTWTSRTTDEMIARRSTTQQRTAVRGLRLSPGPPDLRSPAGRCPPRTTRMPRRTPAPTWGAPTRSSTASCTRGGKSSSTPSRPTAGVVAFSIQTQGSAELHL